MELHAVFETWHIGDGNYPPLKKGQLVNLSFMVDLNELSVVENAATPEFTHLGHAKYRFTGSVLRMYGKPSNPIAIIEAAGFRFYLNSLRASTLKSGDVVSGRGTLSLDYYIWVEFLSDYADPPDLFYPLQVIDILRCNIPERFIRRSGAKISGPCRVGRDDYGPDDITHVDAIEDEMWVNYVLHLSDADIPAEPIPRTFHSSGIEEDRDDDALAV